MTPTTKRLIAVGILILLLLFVLQVLNVAPWR